MPRRRTGSQCKSCVLYQLMAPKLADGNAIEKTGAVVKSASHKRTESTTVERGLTDSTDVR